MQLAQQQLLQLLLAAGLTSSSVPPVGPDGSCAAFRPLPEPTSLAAADAASGVHPYVLRRRYIDAAAASGSGSAGSSPPCDRLSLESNEQLLELLNASAAVSDLAAYAEAGSALGLQTTLAQALERQAEGERLYYQTPLQLRSAAARRSQCGLTLPRHLENEEWQACLGAEMLRLLSSSRLSWLAVFVGVSDHYSPPTSSPCHVRCVCVCVCFCVCRRVS